MTLIKDFNSRSGHPVSRNKLHLQISLHKCLVLLCIYFVRTSAEDGHPEVEHPDQEVKIGNYSLQDTFLQERKLTPDEFQKILSDHKIIPDCIDTSPNQTVQIQFFYGYIVKLGNLIPPENITDHSPHFVKWPGTFKDFFTLIMVDLDEPSRSDPDKREWLHWMIVNIPGWTRYLGELKCRYVPPQPKAESGIHRYVFIVYKQPEKLNFTGLKLINETKHNDLRRGHFSNRQFSKEYGLGDPWAINFFQAKEYVPPKDGKAQEAGRQLPFTIAVAGPGRGPYARIWGSSLAPF